MTDEQKHSRCKELREEYRAVSREIPYQNWLETVVITREQEIARLTKVLGIYADSRNWMGDTFVALEDDTPRWDGGDLARHVVAPLQSKDDSKARSLFW